MSNAQLLTDFIQGVASQLPVFFVALVGAFVTISRWKEAPSAGIWSLLGFGIAALLCILVPAGQMGLRYWLIQNHGHSSQLPLAFTALAIFWSVLRAASYVLLLVAIFAGRTIKAAGPNIV
jgi:hypothetical protein